MSKIFDGLKRVSGEIADLTNEVIGDNAPFSRTSGSLTGIEQKGPRQAAEGWPESDTELAVEQMPMHLDSGKPARAVEATHAKAIGPEDYRQEWFDSPPDEGSGLRSSLEFSTVSLGSRSVTIRLQAGPPLFPFETGDADAAAEEYRRIRTSILQHHLQPRLILVSSPASGDGKSTTAINIGAALALNPDARVLLVDMDLRRPTMAKLLGLQESQGIAEVLAGSCSLEDAVVRLDPFPNLFLLPAGKDRKNPSELLSSPRWKTVCDDLRSNMTFSIIDGPPVDAVAEYSLLQEPTDGSVLVVRTDHTDRSLLSRAIETLPKEKLIGSVINGYRKSIFWKRRGSYYYS